MVTVTPPPFKILVAQLSGSGDPSRGPAGNPVVTVSAMRLQHVVGPVTRQGGPVATIPAVSATDRTASITVAAAEYWDSTVAAPGPFYPREEIRVGDHYFVAGVDFGVGNGSSAGPVADIAADLAAAIRTVPEMDATSVAGVVYITSLRPDGTVPLSASADASALLLGASFSVGAPGGVTYTAAPNYRRIYYVPKSAKTQGPPELI